MPAPRAGLTAKKIKDARGHMRTYWVKAQQDTKQTQLKRLAAAKATTHPMATEAPPPPQAKPAGHPVVATLEAHKYALVPPNEVFNQTKCGPHVQPIKIDFPQDKKLYVSPSKYARPEDVMLDAENVARLRAHADVVKDAYGGSGAGVGQINVRSDMNDLHLATSPNCAAYYDEKTKIFVMRDTFATMVGQAAKMDNTNQLTDNQTFGVNAILHETMHSATGAGQLSLYEGTKNPHHPYTAVEEATTELLAAYHLPGFAAALLPGTPKSAGMGGYNNARADNAFKPGALTDDALGYTRPLTFSTPKDRDVFTASYLAYPDFCTQFTRVACVIERLDVSGRGGPPYIDRAEITKAAAYHAGELKKARIFPDGGPYRKLSTAVMKTFGVDNEPPSHIKGNTKKEDEFEEDVFFLRKKMSEELQRFMQAKPENEPSEVLQQKLIQWTADHHKKWAPPPPAPPPLTPATPPTPPAKPASRKGGRPSTLKRKL